MSKRYPAILNLNDYDVYFEDNYNNPEIFKITGLPKIISYGKTAFYIGFKDPETKDFHLKNNSNILIEATDPDGAIIFSDLVELKSVSNSISGYAMAYIRIDEDPDRNYNPIQDGIGYITLVGELDGNIPGDWKDNYNCRIKYPIEILKDYDNRSLIVFENLPELRLNTFSVDDSTIGRGSLPSVVRTFTNLETDNLNTVGGVISYIDVSYKSDASGKQEFVHLDTYEVSNDIELLTPSSSKAYDSTPIGDFVSNGNAVARNHWDNTRDNGAHNIAFGNGIDSKLSGSISNTGAAANTKDIDKFAYKIVRRTNDEENYTIRYNISGSMDFSIMYTTADTFAPLSWSYSGQGVPNPDTADVIMAYTRSFRDFDPTNYKCAIVNGDINCLDVNYNIGDYNKPTGSNTQIIQDDFTIPSGSWFAVYIKPVAPAVVGSGLVSNISIKPQDITGINPPTFYKHVELQGLARRNENIEFNIKYLNSDMEIALDPINPNIQLISSGSINYKPEGFWIERGYGSGISAQTSNATNISFASRFTNVPTSSTFASHSTSNVANLSGISVGVMGEAAYASQYDDKWGKLKEVSGYGSSAGNNSGYWESGSVVGGWFNAVRGRNDKARIAGLVAQAHVSGTLLPNTEAPWAARFEKGNVFVRDDLIVSGNIEAYQYIVSSSTTYYTQSHYQGSTTFGDSVGDYHAFTGSISMSGDLHLNGGEIYMGSGKKIYWYDTNTYIWGSGTAILVESDDELIVNADRRISLNAPVTASSVSASGNGWFEDLTINDDIYLKSDTSVIHFGDDSDVSITHQHDTGLTFRNTATGDDKPFKLTFENMEGIITAGEPIFQMHFYDKGELSENDAHALAAGIEVVAEDAYTSTANKTKLSFLTAESENATEKMSLSSDGNLTLNGDVYADMWRRKSDSSTTTKINLADEIIEMHAGHASNKTLILKQNQLIADGSITASGDISGSNIFVTGDISGSSMRTSGDIYSQGNITASSMQLTAVNPSYKASISYDGNLTIQNNISSDIKIQSNTFNNSIYIDDSTNGVGIGTTPPNNATAEGLTVEGNISASGTFYGKQFQSYTANFQDDLGTSIHYIPIGTNNFEMTSGDNDEVGFIAPFDGVIHKIMWRQNYDASGTTQRFGLGVVPSGTDLTSVDTSGKFRATVTGMATDTVGTVTAANVDSGATDDMTFSKGETIYIYLRNSTDLTSVSSEHHVTVVFLFDTST